MARLLSVNVGLPRDVPWRGTLVRTAIWKEPVAGPLMVRRLNIDGDRQADRVGHGGENRAVFVYQMDSYKFWQEHLGLDHFDYGQFGENFTVEGLADTEVCIGDRYRVGGALLEVTQPRVTCYRVGIRMIQSEMPSLLVKHGRPGFYFRVLEEGLVQAGDEIEKVTTGPGQMSVTAISALLYLPDHDPAQLERALRIRALSKGWRDSFFSLLKDRSGVPSTNADAGIATASANSSAWPGFRPFRIVRKVRESSNVISLFLEPADGGPRLTALAGQFVVLQLGAGSRQPLIRSYSLSGNANEAAYRVSIKRLPGGLAGDFVDEHLSAGDLVQSSAARGDFTLRPGDGPIILMSAGIGVTPVLSILHELAVKTSQRQVWWLYGARNGREDPFRREVSDLFQALPGGHRYVCYSAPDSTDQEGKDYHVLGHLDMTVIKSVGVPLDGDFYICGPSSFMRDLTLGLGASRVPSECIHVELFGGVPAIAPGLVARGDVRPHPPVNGAKAGLVISFARSGLTVHWESRFGSMLECAEACDVPVRWSCRSGVCHLCKTEIISGEATYFLDPLEKPERGNILICCSRPETDIVVDL